MKRIPPYLPCFGFNLWIFLLLIPPSPQKTLASEADVKFVNKYGNDPNTSGIWQRARDLANNTEKLKNISYEAHMAVWPYYRYGNPIDNARVTNEVMMFPGTNFSDIRADLIAYQLVNLTQITFYLTKGLKPDCVYYVWRIDKAGPKWELKIHVCEIDV